MTSGFCARGKNKLILITEIIIVTSVGFLLYFLSIEFVIVLISAISSSTVWTLTAMMSHSKEEYINSGAGVLNNSVNIQLESDQYTSFNCPNCTTVLSITSDERPLRISCTGCNKVLKIID